MARRITKRQAERAFAVVKREARREGYDTPDMEDLNLAMDWDWSGTPTPTVLWESGPYDWAIRYAHRVTESVSGVFAEPYASYALSLYPE